MLRQKLQALDIRITSSLLGFHAEAFFPDIEFACVHKPYKFSLIIDTV